MGRVKRIFLTGALALLPLMVTIFVISWVLSLLNTFMGPSSWLGRLIASLGMRFGVESYAPYVIGLLVLAAFTYLLGLLIDNQIGDRPIGILDRVMRRIPMVGNVYDLSKRLTSFVDVSGNSEIKAMRPVWCFFGGEPGAAVLALQPSANPVTIGTEIYVGILVPSAPVPVGGALIYVPAKWVRPAGGGVEDLISVYVSMGVTPPKVS